MFGLLELGNVSWYVTIILAILSFSFGYWWKRKEIRKEKIEAEKEETGFDSSNSIYQYQDDFLDALMKEEPIKVIGKYNIYLINAQYVSYCGRKFNHMSSTLQKEEEWLDHRRYYTSRRDS
jgi:hypothetical protein